MCETCSPMCGNCKPPALKAVLCPSCGKASLLTREQCVDALGRPRRGRAKGAPLAPARCASCGADLLPVLECVLSPEPCTYSGIVCGYPCGRRRAPRPAGESPCRTQVPMGRLKQGAASPPPGVL